VLGGVVRRQLGRGLASRRSTAGGSGAFFRAAVRVLERRRHSRRRRQPPPWRRRVHVGTGTVKQHRSVSRLGPCARTRVAGLLLSPSSTVAPAARRCSARGAVARLSSVLTRTCRSQNERAVGRPDRLGPGPAMTFTHSSCSTAHRPRGMPDERPACAGNRQSSSLEHHSGTRIRAACEIGNDPARASREQADEPIHVPRLEPVRRAGEVGEIGHRVLRHRHRRPRGWPRRPQRGHSPMPPTCGAPRGHHRIDGLRIQATSATSGAPPTTLRRCVMPAMARGPR
jgi:hypothetical protein